MRERNRSKEGLSGKAGIFNTWSRSFLNIPFLHTIKFSSIIIIMFLQCSVILGNYQLKMKSTFSCSWQYSKFSKILQVWMKRHFPNKNITLHNSHSASTLKYETQKLHVVTKHDRTEVTQIPFLHLHNGMPSLVLSGLLFKSRNMKYHRARRQKPHSKGAQAIPNLNRTTPQTNSCSRLACVRAYCIDGAPPNRLPCRMRFLLKERW